MAEEAGRTTAQFSESVPRSKPAGFGALLGQVDVWRIVLYHIAPTTGAEPRGVMLDAEPRALKAAMKLAMSGCHPTCEAFCSVA